MFKKRSEGNREALGEALDTACGANAEEELHDPRKVPGRDLNAVTVFEFLANSEMTASGSAGLAEMSEGSLDTLTAAPSKSKNRRTTLSLNKIKNI